MSIAKSQRGAPCPARSGAPTTQRSKVEHVFAEQKDWMDLFIRTIGIARATVKIGLANLVYNIQRSLFLRRTAVAYPPHRRRYRQRTSPRRRASDKAHAETDQPSKSNRTEPVDRSVHIVNAVNIGVLNPIHYLQTPAGENISCFVIACTSRRGV